MGSRRCTTLLPMLLLPVTLVAQAPVGDYHQHLFSPAAAALSVFTDAIAKRDPRLRNVWFDATVVVRPGMTPDVLQQIAARIRQIGVGRVLFGSDAAGSPATYPKAGWASFRKLPLSEAEFGVIANNIAPYLRD